MNEAESHKANELEAEAEAETEAAKACTACSKAESSQASAAAIPKRRAFPSPPSTSETRSSASNSKRTCSFTYHSENYEDNMEALDLAETSESTVRALDFATFTH